MPKLPKERLGLLDCLSPPGAVQGLFRVQGPGLLRGAVSGLLGVGVTLLLSIPISSIIYRMAGIANVAALPVPGAVILVVLSVILTMFAGLIPSRIAAKKDPVAALRSE